MPRRRQATRLARNESFESAIHLSSLDAPPLPGSERRTCAVLFNLNQAGLRPNNKATIKNNGRYGRQKPCGAVSLMAAVRSAIYSLVDTRAQMLNTMRCFNAMKETSHERNGSRKKAGGGSLNKSTPWPTAPLLFSFAIEMFRQRATGVGVKRALPLDDKVGDATHTAHVSPNWFGVYHFPIKPD